MANFNERKNISLSEVLDKFADEIKSNIHTALPAKVVTYSISNNYLIADVSLLIQRDNGEDGYIDYPTIYSVPVQMPTGLGGDAFINVPLSAGDNGMVFFSEAGIDNWLNSDGSETVEPSQLIRHSLSDAVFIPGINPFKKELNNLSTDNIVINNESGGVEIRSKNHVEIKDLDSGQKIKLGNSPSENPVIADRLTTILDTQFTNLDTQLGALGQPGGFRVSWDALKSLIICNKINIPDYTET
jgi:hypothetical protein